MPKFSKLTTLVRRVDVLFLALLVTVTTCLYGASTRHRQAAAPNDYDPLALAIATYGDVPHREAGIPPQCYTKTDGVSNPCWTCHAIGRAPNHMDDVYLQRDYGFSDEGRENHYANLFVDRRADMARIRAEEALAWVREDNYGALRTALARADEYVGFRADLDYTQGFDALGFARDGSGWRAFRYKPFPGAFWPTNGNADDVLIRLPRAFRERAHSASRVVYQANLAVLEASFASDPNVRDPDVRYPIEPIDETALGLDIDGDGTLTSEARTLAGLPTHYFGDASNVRVRRAIYPRETEFLHTVRYVDPDVASGLSRRMKEVRYMRRTFEPYDHQFSAAYSREMNERDEGMLPDWGGHPAAGLVNDFGWMIQGFIEDEAGRLRAQTHQEHYVCMGCHSNLGVTVDQTFSFVRKVPGAAGWGHQSIEGIPDVPQLGHADPEFLTYVRRVGGGDEFRSNAEVLARFVPGGVIDEAAIRRAAPGGNEDMRALVMPSRERAIDLIRAYMLLVRRQRFDLGRDVVLAPPTNVHRRIAEDATTGLEATGRVYLDGTARLDWRGTRFWH